MQHFGEKGRTFCKMNLIQVPVCAVFIPAPQPDKCALKITEKMVFQFACIIVFIPNFISLCNNSIGVNCRSRLIVDKTALCLQLFCFFSNSAGHLELCLVQQSLKMQTVQVWSWDSGPPAVCCTEYFSIQRWAC